MKRGIVLGVLLAIVWREISRWWTRFSAPYGAEPVSMRDQRHWR